MWDLDHLAREVFFGSSGSSEAKSFEPYDCNTCHACDALMGVA